MLVIEQMQNGVRPGEYFRTNAAMRKLGSPTDKSALVFHKYGQQYFLASIWVAWERAGHTLPQGRRERVVVRELEARLGPGVAPYEVVVGAAW
jgi:hypothetical protein